MKKLLSIFCLLPAFAFAASPTLGPGGAWGTPTITSGTLQGTTVNTGTISGGAFVGDGSGLTSVGVVTADGGGKLGTSASATTGGAVGYNAIATAGGSVGSDASATTGGAVGQSASATTGGAVGQSASATTGFAGGVGAIADAGGVNFSSNGISSTYSGSGIAINAIELASSNGAIPPSRTAQRTTFSNTTATISAGTAYLGQTGTMSASRVVNVPLANSVPAGYQLVIADESGTVTNANTVVLTRAGSDLLNNATTEAMASAYTHRRLISNGTNAWLFDAGVARLGAASNTFSGNQVVNGNATFGDAAADEFVVADDDPRFSNLTAATFVAAADATLAVNGLVMTNHILRRLSESSPVVAGEFSYTFAGSGASFLSARIVDLRTGNTASSLAAARTPHTGQSAYMNGVASNTSMNWAVPVAFSFRVHCFDLSADSVLRCYLGRTISSTTDGDSSTRAIGIRMIGRRLWLERHDGTTLASTDTGYDFPNVTGATIGVAVLSDGAGNVSLNVNGALITSVTGGPTTASNASEAGIWMAASNPSTDGLSVIIGGIVVTY